MRLCVNPIGDAIKATAIAQQTTAEIKPGSRGNEDWLAVLINWGGFKREREQVRRGIMQRQRERCHLGLDCGGFFVELVEELENAGANILGHAFRRY